MHGKFTLTIFLVVLDNAVRIQNDKMQVVTNSKINSCVKQSVFALLYLVIFYDQCVLQVWFGTAFAAYHFSRKFREGILESQINRTRTEPEK